jgi:hypothetical protein
VANLQAVRGYERVTVSPAVADATRKSLLRTFYNDRPMAHQILFAHRRPNDTPPFHKKMIEDFHDPAHPQVLDLVFRGSAKSTIAEEAILLRAGFREFKNALIVGETETRAIERLVAIRNEIDTNELLVEVFGDLRGPVWAENELVLSNGVRILAMGRGQAIRGVKYNDMRPDFVFCDDLEDNRSVENKDMRNRTARWFFSELLPACTDSPMVRVAATPLDPDALAVRLTADPDWKVHTYPIERVNDAGEREASWPDRYPLEWIDKRRLSMTRIGLLRNFNMEYMVTVVAPEDRSFTRDMMLVEPQIRTWQAVYAMFDPARTTNRNSATTGFACWSWIGARLVVWDAWARTIMPDEIVKAVFDCALDEQLRPTLIGVEEDGLNEFLLQPLRAESVRRGVTIPYKAMKAPRGKLDFIRGLQPFFKAREVTFAKPLPDLAEQLMGFPTGNIDAPNALAYALKMRPGAAIYDDFTGQNVGSNLQPSQGATLYLAMNATSNLTSGALVQYQDGRLRIFADWVLEGEVAVNAPEIVSMARLYGGTRIRLVGGPLHFDQYNNIGLRQALARLPAELTRGGPTDPGRAFIRAALQRQVKGFAALEVGEDARWTLNGFAGGYARSINKQGMISNAADEGQYRVLMEGIESFASILAAGALIDETEEKNYEFTPNGTRYVSARR